MGTVGIVSGAPLVAGPRAPAWTPARPDCLRGTRPPFKIIARRGDARRRITPGSRFIPYPFPRLGRPFGGYGERPGVGGGRQVVVVWFRNDLRLDDNEALTAANKAGSSVLPVYCFDPRDYGKSPSGFDKTGAYRARFLLEAVQDLRNKLQEQGSTLLVRLGTPEQVLPQLVERVSAKAVYCQSEVTYEEVQRESAVRSGVERLGAQLHSLWGNTLYQLQDLPFSLAHMPSSFADFRSQMTSAPIRPALPPPATLKRWPMGAKLEPGQLPTLEQLKLSRESIAASQADKFSGANGMRGGESEAQRRLQHFVGDIQKGEGGAQAFKSLGLDFSCKISPWLAMGCLSPRRMYHALAHHVAHQGGAAQQLMSQQPGTAVPSVSGAGPAMARGQPAEQSGSLWLQFELLWRDFFRFITKKYSAIPSQQLGANKTALAPATPALTVA